MIDPDLAAWQKTNADRMTIKANDDGTYRWKLATAGGWENLYTGPVTVVPGETYEIAFDYKAESTSAGWDWRTGLYVQYAKKGDLSGTIYASHWTKADGTDDYSTVVALAFDKVNG